MIHEVQDQIDRYWVWLQDRTNLRQIGDWVEITAPYLDRHNDYLQIYAKRLDKGFLLTDDGYILEDLEQTGCNLESPKRRDLLRTTLRGFGVKLKDKSLTIEASVDDLSLRKHSLLQAMLAVNDLFYLASSTVVSLFREDVTDWLDLAEIRYTPDIKLTGKSGYDHRFDFVIPKSKAQPERLLNAINSPSRSTAQSMAFSWIDTREARTPESRAYVILNDSRRAVSENVLAAMQNYDVKPISWSDRDQALELLAA